MIDPDRLLVDTKSLVRRLVDDLRGLVADGDPITVTVRDTEYARAHAAGRTALARDAWAEDLYAQVAAAWVLAAVFVRFCEDNELGPEPLLAGPGKRRAVALDHRSAYLSENPDHDDRHWLREIINRYRKLPATGEVFGPHNPLWLLAPSADGARELVQAVQEVDPETGDIKHDFTDESWDTRFLGDLYQDLSDHAKSHYALLQTPEFVEEFILDRTLEPAIKTFGLRDTTLIDPTCGSGHFLLGAFRRLFARWQEAEPGTNPRELARRSLDAIAGVDLNPFAASIARFRLLIAALKAGGDKTLKGTPTYPIQIAVGDSLLHCTPPGRLKDTLISDELVGPAAHGYLTEDVEEARALLNREWHAVVGNPPYIVVRDRALRDLYRSRFKTCHGQYSLCVPFTEQFFHLAQADPDPERSGYVGMIVANSFMKRQFGKKFVEQWVPTHDLVHVVDTSGAFIPGHDTPTVLLFGRNRAPISPTVRTVMGIRGEPSKPSNPGEGLVWSSIRELADDVGSQNDYIDVVDLDRTRLTTHPWSIGGGGAAELKEFLDANGHSRLHELIETVCTVAITREDDAYLAPSGTWTRFGVPPTRVIQNGYGSVLRDYIISPDVDAVFPYDEHLEPTLGPGTGLLHVLWPAKQHLLRRKELGGYQIEVGKTWYEWNRFLKHRFAPPLGITFAFVASHNHFALNRHRIALSRSCPVIKLTPGATEQQHLRLLGVLGSSTACFWMQQTFHDKGNRGAGGGIVDEAWERFFEHDATKLKQLPLPMDLDATAAARLDRLAQERASVTPSAIAAAGTPSAEELAEAEQRYHDIGSRMIAIQEQLDWEVYRRYGLVDEELTTGDEPEPALKLGERAFEIVLARKVAAGKEQTSWFERHGSIPITELPAHWPDEYKKLVERRIELIETDLSIGLIERPEHKRRWLAKPWADQVKAALRTWLLHRLEDPRYWPEPAALTSTARLAAQARTDAAFVQVAQLYKERDDIDIAALVAELVKAEAVPYLAVLRYTENGMRTYSQWLKTWELQRLEDAGEDVDDMPVPPKYKKSDFQGVVWDHRGKLDVPKERFISYPGAERETDPSLVIGWAGWDHLARARALAAWYLQAKRDGRDREEHLTPLLAGLDELVPWLRQWYDEPHADPALDRPGSQIAAFLEAELRAQHLTHEDLTDWRPKNRRKRTAGGRARR